jgi:hypothetical protein
MQDVADKQSRDVKPPRLVANLVRVVHDAPVHRVKRPLASTTMQATDDAQSMARSVLGPLPMSRSDHELPFQRSAPASVRSPNTPTAVQEAFVGQDRSIVTKSAEPVEVAAALVADHAVPEPVRYFPSTTVMHQEAVAHESSPWWWLPTHVVVTVEPMTRWT